MRADVEIVERTLPHNLEAERSVLGAILVHNESYEVVADKLQPDYFYRDAHKRIYRAIRELAEKRVTVDFVTLKEELIRSGDLDEVGGPAYVSSLADGVPRATNVKYYADIVREKHALRGLIFAGNAMLSSAYEAEQSADDILSSADRALMDLQRGKVGRATHLKGSVRGLMDDLDWRINHRGELIGIDTGFKELNAETFGWQPGDLVAIGARPSVGKTALALNMAIAAARQGKRVVVFSLEMRAKQIEYRLLSTLSGVPLTRLLGGTLGTEDYKAISAAFEVMHDLPIIIDDRADRTAQDIRMECRRLKSDGGLDEVIIDYFQLMSGNLDRRNPTRTEELSDISRRGKRMAEELEATVLLLSQLKRLAGGRPTLEDFRDCGSLEQDCDVGLLLHRKNHREGGVTEAILAKQRMGPTGTVLLSFDRDTVTFTDAPEGAAPAAEEEPRRPSTKRKYAIAAKRRRSDEAEGGSDLYRD